MGPHPFLLALDAIAAIAIYGGGNYFVITRIHRKENTHIEA